MRILFENGGGADPGAPAPRFEADYPSWPVPGITATPWYFGADGALVGAAPKTEAADSYKYDPSHQHDTTIAGLEPERDVGQAARLHVEAAHGRYRACRTRPRRSRTT